MQVIMTPRLHFALSWLNVLQLRSHEEHYSIDRAQDGSNNNYDIDPNEDSVASSSIMHS
jgi:hypothetical protein